MPRPGRSRRRRSVSGRADCASPTLAPWIHTSGASGRGGLAWARRSPSLPASSEENTSELQSLKRISYAVLCLKKKKTKIDLKHENTRRLKNNIKDPCNKT